MTANWKATVRNARTILACLIGMIDFIITEVEYAPIIDAALVVHARWIPKPIIGDCIYACSNCDKVRDAYCEEDGNFCAKCGAKMDAKEKTGD